MGKIRSKTMKRAANVFCCLIMAMSTLQVPAQNPPEPVKPPPTTVPDTVGVFFAPAGSVHEFVVGQEPVAFQGATWTQAQGSTSFAASEMGYDAKPVKGAPYTADAVTETIQVLGDGNRIVRRNVTSIARDSEGRTRREQNLANIGPWPTDQNATRVFISDPVLGKSWILDPKAMTASLTMPPVMEKMMAMRSPMPAKVAEGEKTAEAELQAKKMKVSNGVLQGSAVVKVQPEYPQIAKAAGAQGAVQVQIVVDEQGSVTNVDVVSGHPLLREAAAKAAQQWKFKPTELSGNAVKVQGTLTFNFTLDPPPPPPPPGTATAVPSVATGGTIIPQGGGYYTASASMAYPKMEAKKEDLGKQVIEGVECVGTRIVNTIPSGAIGNERAIEIVFERWYSDELQVVVMTRNSDPRSGETIYRLTNVIRKEPSADLFKLPSDYTVVEPTAKPMMLRRDGPPGQ